MIAIKDPTEIVNAAARLRKPASLPQYIPPTPPLLGELNGVFEIGNDAYFKGLKKRPTE